MAKIVKTNIPQSKEKESLDSILASINSAKAELSNVEEQLKRQEAIVVNGAEEAGASLIKCEELAEEISNKTDRLSEIDLELHAMKRELGLVSNTLSETEVKAEEERKRLAELNMKSSSYFASFEADKKTRTKKEEGERNASKEILEEELKNRRDEIKKLTEKHRQREKVLSSLEISIDNAGLKEVGAYNKVKCERDSEISLKESVSNGLSRDIEKREQRIIDIDKTIKSLIESADNTIRKQKEEEDKISLIKETKIEVEGSLRLLQLERESTEIENDKKKDELTEEIKIETAELDKIRSQRFGIVKANKDLHKLHVHVSGLYEKAGVPMPKINLNIK